MRTLLTIDRFEDGGLAVLEDQSGESIIVPRTDLPPSAAEGDVLSVGDPDKGEPTRYRLEPVLTKERKDELAAKRANLTKGPTGDFDL